MLGPTLDAEKIKWMMHRLDDRWWEDDSVEIYEKLRKDMDKTMNFLECCTKEELDRLDEIIIDLLDDFEDHGNGEYMAFLDRLADAHSDEGLKDKGSRGSRFFGQRLCRAWDSFISIGYLLPFLP